MSQISNISLHETERRQAGRYVERHGMVTSYDPDTYLAKVSFMPEGQESGWLPIETGHIGNGFGIAIGLTPGDGKKTGDQVIVRYQEGDIESGKIVQRVHSDQDKPPKVQAGEMVFWHQKGAKIFFAQDGSLTFQDGNGASIKFDGQGNIGDVAKKKTESFSADHSVSVGGNKNVTVNGQRQDSVKSVWDATAAFGMWPWVVAKTDMDD